MARRRRRNSWTPYKDMDEAGCCGTGALLSCMTCGSFYSVAMMAIVSVIGLCFRKK